MPDHVATPGQTVGPFFHHALPFPGDRELVPRGSPAAVRLHGYVFDGAGNGVPDALLEIRQAGADGVVPEVEGSLRRDGAAFTGWGRSSTDPAGHYWFSTIEPPVFFAVTVFARGLLNRLFTRIYLPESAPDGSSTMVAAREVDGSLRFDVHLQGERETVFLTYPGHQ